MGADVAEKGKVIQIISEIFTESRQELYYSPFERSFPCALYLPDLNSLVASVSDGCNYTGAVCRYYDMGKTISAGITPIEEIVGYTMSQSRAYMHKSLELIGIADLLLKEYVKNGAELFNVEKVRRYAGRKISSIAEDRGGRGNERMRAVSAVTCGGYRFIQFPGDYSIIRLCDDYIAASRAFASTASKTANKLGYDTIISYAVDCANAPLHLVIPQLKTAFVTETVIFESQFPDAPKINFSRFYINSLLDSREHDICFFGDYIKRTLKESALYARICMDIRNQSRKLLRPYISENAAAETASEIVYGILNS